jgi:ubiquinone/menaquinone biosynthesis C-methylase UbiE
MTTFETQYSLFGQIEIKKKMDIQWLVTSGAPGERIANFGCGNGFETLALICAFGANEAIGIDKDGEKIRQGRDLLEMIKENVQVIFVSVYHRAYPQSWWESKVPDPLKGLIFSKTPRSHIPGSFRKELRETSVIFIEADIAEPIAELGSDCFDLAYCRRVLYQIRESQGMDEVKSAINQMARVVKNGGWVVAVEPAVSRDGRPYDFRQFFKQVKLTQVTDIDSAVLEQAGLLVPVADNRKWYSSPGLYPYIYCRQLEEGDHNDHN